MIPLYEAYKYGIERVGSKAYYLSLASKYANVPNGFVLPIEYFEEWRKTGKININENLLDKNKIYIVRSSANLEDYKKFSFAGMFESILFVRRENIKEAIERVYKSLYSERVINYCKNHKINPKELKMAVIIQEMITNGKFGVLFSYNNYKIIQAGLTPTAVTSGNTITDIYILEGDKIYKYPSLDAIILFEDEIRELAKISSKLENIIREHDIEWSIDLNENFWILQLRPITEKFCIGYARQYGFPASPGKAIGRVVKYKKDFGKDKIAIADEIPLNETDKIKEYSGIILEIPGLLSHAAIIAREYGIPCIVGVPISIFKEGELIEIDGSTGEIKFLERNAPEITKTRRKIEFNPLKIRLFSINKCMYLVYDNDFSVLYYPATNKINLHILKELQISIGKVLLDGGIDRWHLYSIPLEMIQNGFIKKEELEKCYEYIKNCDIKKFYEHYEHLINKAIEFFNKGLQSKDLLNKLLLYDISFSYWRLAQSILLYDLAENACEEIKNICKTLENDNRANDLINNLEKEIDRVITEIEKISGINYKEYFSELEFINDAKNKIR